MPGLTVTEKEHWKNRIAQRIDRRIEALWAVEPNLQDRIERDARAQALTSLGLADLEAEVEAIERQTAANERRKRELDKQKLATVRRVPVEQLGDYYSYQHDQEVDSADRFCSSTGDQRVERPATSWTSSLSIGSSRIGGVDTDQVSTCRTEGITLEQRQMLAAACRSNIDLQETGHTTGVTTSGLRCSKDERCVASISTKPRVARQGRRVVQNLDRSSSRMVSRIVARRTAP